MTSKRTQHLVVDGSNIATEGRTTPSLGQLDEAVRAVVKEGFDPITVIVDATFPRRIEGGEVDEFEARTLDGTIVTPPAGVVGRGDAFILQVAAQVDAVVLSNDSFQEFHGEHEWLLTEDQRLLGGKPVPNVGWVFAWRGPVRGPKSRQSIKAAKSKAAKTPTPEEQALPKPAKRPSRKATRKQAADSNKQSEQRPKQSEQRPKQPKQSEQRPKQPKQSEQRPKQPKQPEQPEESSPKVNEPHHLNDVNEFMAFVTKYSIGDTIQGHVERYSSHGCYLRAATAQCYLPIKAMGDPPPTKARDVLSKGDLVRARVESLDAHRRGINVSLVSVTPQAGSNDHKQTSNPPRRSENIMATPKKSAKKRTTKKAAPKKAVKKAAPKKAAPKKAAPKKAVKRTTKKAAPKKAVKRTTKKAAPKKAVKKAAPKKAVKRTTKKAAPKKAVKKAAPKKAVKRTTKKAAPKKACEAHPKKAAKRTTKKAAPKKAAKRTTKKAAPKKAVKRTTKKATPKKR